MFTIEKPQVERDDHRNVRPTYRDHARRGGRSTTLAYDDHRQEIDEDIRDSDAFIEALRRQIPSKVAQKLQVLYGDL